MGVAERHDRDEADREAEAHPTDFVGVTVTATNGPNGWQASGWLGLLIERLKKWTQATSSS